MGLGYEMVEIRIVTEFGIDGGVVTYGIVGAEAFLALLLTCIVIFVDPIAEVFSLATYFGFDECVIAACYALTSIVVVELVKAMERAVHKKKNRV